MPTAFAIDLSQLPEALRSQLKLWVERTAASFGEEGSMLFFVRKKPTERRNLMRSIQTLAKASWEMELPAGNWLRDVDIVSKAETTDNEPSDDPRCHAPSGSHAQTFIDPCRTQPLRQRPRPSITPLKSTDPSCHRITPNKSVE